MVGEREEEIATLKVGEGEDEVSSRRGAKFRLVRVVVVVVVDVVVVDVVVMGVDEGASSAQSWQIGVRRGFDFDLRLDRGDEEEEEEEG